MKRLLTEAQAWREIARRIVEGAEMPFGLCDLAVDLWIYDKVDLSTYKRMLARVACGLEGQAYAFPAGEEREARTLAALWMALEAEAGIVP